MPRRKNNLKKSINFTKNEWTLGNMAHGRNEGDRLYDIIY